MITIIDYRAGNLQSVENAFEALGHETHITNDPDELRSASAIVLPGVGAFGDGMASLRELGLVDVLNKEVIEKKKPYLGICLGLQFLADESHEHGTHRGLGWLKGTVEKIKINDNNKFRVPHVGWNELNMKRPSLLFDNFSEGMVPVFYFVHSFSLVVAAEDQDVVTSTCWHDTDLTASIQKENIFGVQFHPEKSQKAGLRVLENFINYIEGRDAQKKAYSSIDTA